MSATTHRFAGHLDVRPEVAEAITRGRAVVALETSLVTHGFAYPTNLEVVRSMWEALEEGGALPAIIGVRDGRLVVGLTLDEADDLARRTDNLKITRANLSWALSQRRSGGTTVTVTMMAAEAAGITVFCTGGLGGVHRGAYGFPGTTDDATLDVSADLEELARTRVVVVCGGVKSILDVPKTLEYLETKGVPVITWGQADFPGFWSASSGLRSPLATDDLDDVVRLVRTHVQVGLPSGIVVGVPVPTEHELPLPEAEAAVAIAVEESAHVKGGDVTPWMLQRVQQVTSGRSEATNKQELLNNARKSAIIAVALTQPG